MMQPAQKRKAKNVTDGLGGSGIRTDGTVCTGKPVSSANEPSLHLDSPENGHSAENARRFSLQKTE